MTDVFISYKRRLRPRVDRLAAALRALGLDVWYDAGIVPGASFSAEISARLREARAVLVCWSPDVFEQENGQASWVLAEATMGRDRRVLVPVKLEETLLEPPWNILHHEDLTTFDPEDPASDRTAWQQVLLAIGQHTGRTGLADFDRALHAPGITPLRKWAQHYSDDPLAARAWDEIERRETDPGRTPETAPPPAMPFVSPAPGRAPADVAPPTLREALPPAGPWSRYFARLLDMVVWGMAGVLLFAGILAAFVPSALDHPALQNDLVAGMVALAAGTLLNGIVFGLFSTTLGKMVFGIRVFRVGSDRHVPFGAALRREFGVWVRGLGLGLPLVSLITTIIEYRRVRAGRPASYDENAFVVRQKDITVGRRGFGMVLATVALFGAGLLVAWGNNMETETEATPPSARSWTNPYSGKAVTLPGVWTWTEGDADDGSKYSLLTNSQRGLEIIVGLETLPDLAIEDYTTALEKSFDTQVKVTSAWTTRGNLRRADATINALPAAVYVWKLNDRFWRLIMLDTTGKAPGFPDTGLVDIIAATFN